jgi:hypothetical protein
LLQKLPIGVRRGGEAAGDLHTQLGERADHLTQRGVFAAHGFDVVHSKSLEGDDVCVQGDPLQLEASDITLATVAGR